jgi:urea carboxylase-associated protein 2
VSDTGPTVPSTAATHLPAGVAPGDVVWDEVIGAGGYASRRLPRGAVLRISDLHGDACIQLVVHSAVVPAERINVADTVKVQWQAYVGEGALLLSDMGRVLMTIVGDTSGRHDCLCGAGTAAANAARYGDGRVSGPTPAARDLLCLAAAKHGLGRGDVPPGITLFRRAVVTADGSLHLDPEHRPGAWVELRAEQPVIASVANTPHVLDERPTYTATTARCTAWRTTHPDPDPFRDTTPERRRAFENTDELLGGMA